MRVPLGWLREYVNIDVTPEELAERWTLAGLEVESIEKIGDWWDRERIVVGAITRVEPHPAADRLVLAWVDRGAGAPHRVVTGAPNLMHLRTAGDLERPLKVAFALEGADLYDGHQEGRVRTRLVGRPVRGIPSDAMVCSEKELGLSDDHTGIMVLPDEVPVGAPLADVLGEVVIDVDLTANLARAMNMVGLARETAALLGHAFAAPVPSLPPASTAEPGDRAADLVAVEIEAPDLCPRYTARVVRGVSIGPAPFWMARRLTLAGMRPISSVVDITNYVMLEWGEPLHAFDYDRLRERVGGRTPRITVRRARPGERMVTLDDVDRALDADTLLICDDAGPVAIAGVMGGQDGEVTPETRTILLEAAAFDFISIRRTSRMQKLPSESSARFGRGVHPSLCEPASVRAASLMSELAGGRPADGVVDAWPRQLPPVVVPFDPREVRRQLGVDVPTDEAFDILRRLEFAVADRPGPDGAWAVTVPDHRMDVGVPADLIEEVARIHGYDRLPSTLIADDLPPQRGNERLEMEERVRDALVAAGLQEAVSYRLTAVEHESPLWQNDPPPTAEGYVVLANPISPERSAMRRSILTGVLDALTANRRQWDRVALFEIGPVYCPGGGQLPEEPRRVGIAMTGLAGAVDWRGGPRRAIDYYDAKGAVEALLESLGVEAAWSAGTHPSLHPGRTAAVTADGVLLGHVGELHPAVRAAWDLGDVAVAVADLDLEALQAAARRERHFAPIAPYPAVTRDLAVVVGDDVPAAAVADVIRSAGGPLLVDLALFDVYRGAQVGDGRKSLAWSLTFQSSEGTLEGAAVDKLREKIARSLQARLGGEIR